MVVNSNAYVIKDNTATDTVGSITYWQDPSDLLYRQYVWPYYPPCSCRKIGDMSIKELKQELIRRLKERRDEENVDSELLKLLKDRT
jgi:hypothetical protein